MQSRTLSIVIPVYNSALSLPPLMEALASALPTLTDMAVMDFEPASRRMRVICTHPGFGFGDVQENCGFELLKADEVSETLPPTDEELDILRNQVDPYRYVIGRG